MRGQSLGMRIIGALVLILAGVGELWPTRAQGQDWKEETSTHFIIKYPSAVEAAWARSVLRRAEYFYDKIAREIGYARYQHYWTWNERVPITVYANQAEFMRQTGQPAWSRGSAIGHRRILASRAIVTFKQEAGFLNGVLPHEISHLILRDFIGFHRKIPQWFDEGVAQLQEEAKLLEARRVVKKLLRANFHIPLEALARFDVRRQADPTRVTIFYAQSVTMVDYLIKKYGSRRFGQLCRTMKAGKPFPEALKQVYHSVIPTLELFEKKWLSYMKN